MIPSIVIDQDAEFDTSPCVLSIDDDDGAIWFNQDDRVIHLSNPQAWAMNLQIGRMLMAYDHGKFQQPKPHLVVAPAPTPTTVNENVEAMKARIAELRTELAYLEKELK